MKTNFFLIARVLSVFTAAATFFSSHSLASTLTITEGQSARIQVTADGTQPFTYQWRKNGTAISGATDATYTISAATTADSANYSAMVTNAVGSIISDDAGLMVYAAGGGNVTAPAITSQPASLTVTAGQAASFSVTASGSTTLTYQWRKNATAISGATNSTYSIAATTAADAASYSVVVTNSAGSVTSSSATLTMNTGVIAPVITTQSGSLKVTTGQSASFSVTASGSAPLSYQWLKDRTAISGATNSTYFIAATTSNDVALYSAVVSNSAGSATSSTVTLSVNTDVTAPAITSQPTSRTVTAGQPASFSVTASGSATLTYQWRKNATAISGATDSTYSITSTSALESGTGYSVAVSNSAGTVTSNTATLTVNAVVTAPAITSQPASLTVTAGQPASFSVTASGSATLTYQWRKNATAISGATNSTYSITSTSALESGTGYSVAVSNSAGTVTSNTATLTVNAVVTAPAITSQPASLTVTAGQAASFSVTASGSATLTYQWRKNATAISGATNSTYSIAATTAADAASYSVVVTNSAGSVTSSSAVLTMNTGVIAPVITTQSGSLKVTTGQSASFSVTASGSAPLSYQWLKDRTAISGATNSTYLIAATTSNDIALYSVVVTNSAGSATSSTVTLSVNTDVSAPAITSQPTSRTVTAGQPASFSVTASGSATLTYQWRKNATAISGATDSTYSIAATTAADAAVYSVLVTNSLGSATSSSAVLTVNTDLGLVELTPLSFSASGQNAPAEGIAQLFDGQITTKWLDFSGPSWVQITLSAPASLQAYGLTSANDMPERDPVSWTLSGSNDGVTWTIIETRNAQTWSNRYLVRDFILAAPSAPFNQFRFDFVSTSLSSNQLAEIELFGLTGNSLPAAPFITNQPESIIVTAGRPASFSVAATSTATLTYQWLKNGSAIAGATNSAYTLAASTTADAADYSVVVSNFASSVTSASVSLTVNPAITAPTIITQPASLTVTAGQSASFSVTASDSATLTYQWLKNGAVVLGATDSTYTITTTKIADAANYSIFVANSAGSATSGNATLTINPALNINDLTPVSYSASGQLTATLAIANLFDGQPATKWVDSSASSWVGVTFASPTVLEAYSLTSANDAPERDPASWTLSGSNDGTNWILIETRTAENWRTRLLVRDFILTAPSGAFTQFRFDFKATSGSTTQLADLELFGKGVTSVKLNPTAYSARGQASTSQSVAKLFDNRNSTKWMDLSGTSWVKIVLSSPALLRRYTLTSAADTSAYDPASWTLSGSNNDINWTVIETRADQSWSSRRLTRDFVFTAPATAFSRYRFDFRGKSGSVIQLAELKLYGDAAVPTGP